MTENGYKTIAILLMAVILAIILANPMGTNVIYENTNAVTSIGTPYVVVDGGLNQQNLDIKDRWLTYTDTTGGNSNIGAYDSVNESTVGISSEIWDEYRPKAHGDDIVWSYADGECYLSGFNTRTLARWSYLTSPNGEPLYAYDVYDGVVYYSTRGSNPANLKSYDIYTNVTTDLTGDGSINEAYQINVYGSVMACRGLLNGVYTAYYYNITTQGSIALATGVANVNVYGTKIAYSVTTAGDEAVVVYDTKTGRSTTVIDTEGLGNFVPRAVAVYDEWVAFSTYAGTTGAYDSYIAVYNLDTKFNATIAVAEHSDRFLGNSLDISDNIVYYDYAPKADYYDIWACDLGETEHVVITDVDEDGMDDEWELQIVDFDANDSYEDIYDVEPDDDFDEDGFTNLEEFEAGTDPTDPLDFPAPPPDPIKDNLIYIVLAVVAVAVLIGLEIGYFKSKHIKAINKKIPIGIVVSIIAIGVIILYWVVK